MDETRLETEIGRIVDQLPVEFRLHLENLAIVVEKRPTKSQLKSLGIDPERGTLYGLYEGTPLPQRSAVYPPLLPDKITIYSEPLLSNFPDSDEQREQLRLTVLHEIAHYFGMDEEEIEKLGY